MLKRINPTLAEGQSIGDMTNDLDELIKADVRGHLHAYGSWKKLAETANVSYSTIENLAYGVTKNPQQRTLTQLMSAMGHGAKIREAYRSENPVLTAAALKKAPSGVQKRYKTRLAAQTAAIKKRAAKKAKKKEKVNG
ncbi:MAG: hypothetical protein ACI9SY_000350 [Candidatus Paceibacteria bacterium]|jgi:hypothetical protein